MQLHPLSAKIKVRFSPYSRYGFCILSIINNPIYKNFHANYSIQEKHSLQNISLSYQLTRNYLFSSVLGKQCFDSVDRLKSNWH